MESENCQMEGMCNVLKNYCQFWIVVNLIYSFQKSTNILFKYPWEPTPLIDSFTYVWEWNYEITKGSYKLDWAK